jgi:ABC-type phosphate transport system substrate-binding protein
MKKFIPTEFVVSLIILFLFISSSTFNFIADGRIAIIVNNDNPAEKLTAGEAKLYWLRKIKKRWPETNKNILPVDRKAKCAERDAFYAKVLNMNADDVESYFSNRQYQNAEKPQDKFASDSEIIEFVSKEIGAIGFVSQSALSGDAKSKVKVVLTIE